LSAVLSPSNDVVQFQSALLAWYDRNRRDLPWRKTRDPYAIWLSEIMLQQTRVAAVLGYYRIFLERFPDVAALAAASEDAVLAAWSGLGYYRRARMLHQCAREIGRQNQGRFPRTSDALRELPGIGRYTAAAIASIAFDEPVAVVDGNVERVLQRLTGRHLAAQQCWERAEALLSKSRAGDFNQSMMELGATVCLHRDPHCLVCPVREFCATQGEQARSPSMAAKLSPRQVKREIWCALDRRDGHVRLVKRGSKTSLMAGMWELPQWPGLPHPSAEAARWRTFRHSITVTDYRVHVLRDWKLAGSLARGKWVAIDQIPQLPLTGLARKVLKADGII
jgi:A/G-specific adenine glycosylase